VIGSFEEDIWGWWQFSARFQNIFVQASQIICHHSEEAGICNQKTEWLTGERLPYSPVPPV